MKPITKGTIRRRSAYHFFLGVFIVTVVGLVAWASSTRDYSAPLILVTFGSALLTAFCRIDSRQGKILHAWHVVAGRKPFPISEWERRVVAAWARQELDELAGVVVMATGDYNLCYEDLMAAADHYARFCHQTVAPDGRKTTLGRMLRREVVQLRDEKETAEQILTRATERYSTAWDLFTRSAEWRNAPGIELLPELASNSTKEEYLDRIRRRNLRTTQHEPTPA